MGEYDFSENVVVDDGGDVVLAPQPKKEPSLEAPGDFGAFCIVVLESYESLEKVRESVCGGAAFVEKMDMFEWTGVVDLESLSHASGEYAGVNGNSLSNRAGFAKVETEWFV